MTLLHLFYAFYIHSTFCFMLREIGKSFLSAFFFNFILLGYIRYTGEDL
jgi:hypothetical protein